LGNYLFFVTTENIHRSAAKPRASYRRRLALRLGIPMP
jgi:hypothetical protein